MDVDRLVREEVERSHRRYYMYQMGQFINIKFSDPPIKDVKGFLYYLGFRFKNGKWQRLNNFTDPVDLRFIKNVLAKRGYWEVDAITGCLL